MAKKLSELPLRLPQSAHFVSVRNSIEKMLGPIIETLYMVMAKDQRLGAKIFYEESGFLNVAQTYVISAIDLRKNWNQDNYDNLFRAASGFTEFVLRLYPEHKTRMLTTLRSQAGLSFSTLYKNSVLLMQRLEPGLSDDSLLDRIDIPEQQASPIYTKVENERVVLDSGHSLHPFLRKEGVSETRRYLQKELSELSEALKSSNVDRKYHASFDKLTELIEFEDDAGAISFGLHVRLVFQLTKKIEEELSDILAVKIGSTLTHSAYFASQYKDWIEFLYNAKNYPSRESIEGEVDEALDKVTSLLVAESGIVDPSVPQSIRFILTMLNGTAEDRRNAIYAGVRGVENICIATIKYAYGEAIRLLQDAGKKARPTIVKVGAIAIIGLALTVISYFMPVIRGAPELSWILENLPSIERIHRILK